jgi:hypothetical protein
MSELIADGLGLAFAVGCALGIAHCVLMAASVVDDDDRIHILRHAISARWAYRLAGLLMIIMLENVIHYT